ncbi:hypothetical protein B0O44_11279 [Pedobacter nutrimenti]|uniref:Uncharacterized protein n=1 Tax=Pedobacter nutrimenti TaxID=1241337 RepID=A0A318U7I6_9SPHI|nr:hypothetical protein B0O44_11279 [Pedobacter nutrimenti]
MVKFNDIIIIVIMSVVSTALLFLCLYKVRNSEEETKISFLDFVTEFAIHLYNIIDNYVH